MIESYANISFEAQSFIVIRGGKVSFSAETINMKLGLKNDLDKYGAFLKRATKKTTAAEEKRPHLSRDRMNHPN